MSSTANRLRPEQSTSVTSGTEEGVNEYRYLNHNY